MSNREKKRTFFIIPQTKENVKAEILLACGFILILVGLVYAVLKFRNGENSVSVIQPVVFLVLGELFLFSTFAFSKNAVTFCLGQIFIMTGILNLLYAVEIIKVPFAQTWPSIVLFVGFSVFTTGIYKNRAICATYMFPSIMIFLMGVIFFLFSFKIITQEFRDVVSRMWPFVFICIGVFLVSIFFIQQKSSKDFPYMKDDSVSENFEDDIKSGEGF